MTDESFLTTNEVLRYLQVNLRTVYRLVKAGRLPAVRVGRQWRFRRSDIDQWLEHQRLSPGSTPQAPARGQGTRLERSAVLVVDDDAGVREMLLKALTRADYEVDVVSHGQAALDRLRRTRYDLLMVDLQMPGMDGLSVIREAKRFRADLPIVIITGYSSETSAIEAVNLGVKGYLTKPFRIAQVLAVTQKVLGA